MEHPNHKITEASLTFNVKLDADQFMDCLPQLKKELANNGFRFVRRFPSQLNLSFHPQGITIQPTLQEEGHLQLLFHNPNKSYILNVGTSLLGFHVVNQYTGWDFFKDDFINPMLDKTKSILGSGEIVGGVFNYINVFSLSEIELTKDWFTFIQTVEPLTEINLAQVWSNKEGIAFRLEANVIPTRDNQLYFRVAPIAGTNFESATISLSDSERINILADRLHAEAKNIFLQNTGKQLLAYISKKGL